VKPRHHVYLFTATALFLTGLFAFQPALAQTFSLDLGGDTSATTRIVQIIALTTVLSLAPSLLVMITSFTRFIIVLGFIRTAMGTQQTPPNQVLVALALFLTLFVMTPTFEAAYEEGIRPLMDGELEEVEAMERAFVPFHRFMSDHVRREDLMLFMDLSNAEIGETAASIPLKALIPAFMISEIRRAFEIGFLLFVPFLIIDMVVASVLMSMGMMMLPPIIVALPFKIIFFVLVDGWHLVAGSLVKSFGG